MVNDSPTISKLNISNSSKHKKCNRLIIIISQDCNLACKYCYAQQGTYGNSNDKKYMSIETYKKSIKFFLSRFPDGIDSIQFFGGEPLLNFRLMIEACQWTKEYFKTKNLNNPIFSIVTNGTIISEKIIEFFNEYNFRVTISLDGNKEVNDINRVYKDRDISVFDTIEKNVNIMNKKRKFSMGFEMTIDKPNVIQFINSGRLIDIEKALSLGPDNLHIVPAQWIGKDSALIDKEFLNNFIRYFDELGKLSFNETINNKVYFSSTVNLLTKLKRKEERIPIINKNFCAAGISDFSVDITGDIYPCFMLTGVKEFKISNVYDSEDNNKFESITKIFKDTTYENTDECNQCWASGICNGCVGANYLCEMKLNKPLRDTCIFQKTILKRNLFEYANLISK